MRRLAERGATRSVMPGLVPGIHDLRCSQRGKIRDGRVKPGHDDVERPARYPPDFVGAAPGGRTALVLPGGSCFAAAAAGGSSALSVR